VFTFAITPESNISLGRVAENIFLGPFAQFSWILLSLSGVALIKNSRKKQKAVPRKIRDEQEEEDEENE